MFIFSLLFFQETNFLRDKPLGFNKNQIIFFKLDDAALKDKYLSFKKVLMELPGVAGATRSSLAAWQFGMTAVSTIKCPETGINAQARLMLVDSDYLNVYEIPIIEGKNFPESAENMKDLCIINDTARHLLKINNITDKRIIQEGKHPRQIIGTAKDFHFQYPLKKIDPLVMVVTDNYYGMNRSYISVKLLPRDHKETILNIREAVNHFFPKTVFSHEYVDRKIEKMHWEKNDPWKNILAFSTWVSVFLACLGLFGFAEYEIDRKTKEIGIRKVLGATGFQIGGDFIRRFALIAIMVLRKLASSSPIQ